MAQKPVQHDNAESDQETKPSTNKIKFSLHPRMPSRQFMIGLTFILFVLLAVYGIITATTSHSEDPASLVAPHYVVQKKIEKKPDDLELEIQVTEPQQVDTSDTQIIPNQQQTESEIILPAQQNEDIQNQSPLAPQKPIAPQSMIDWKKYQKIENDIVTKTALLSDKKAKIVIVIDDMGLNRRNSLMVADINAPLTLAYLPYADALVQQTRNAADRGHELIVHMPMQPEKMAQNNPGPNALLSDLSSEENLKRLDKNLNSFEGYIGLNNHMGSALTANEKALRPIMAEIKDRGLWFLDSRTIGSSVAGKLAAELDIPYVTRDVFLDNVNDVTAIKKQLQILESIAVNKGYAVAIGHPHDATIAALKSWLPDVQKRGFDVVPLSEVIAYRFPNASIPRYARFKGQTSYSENHVKTSLDQAL
jgi:polysaccharide deacetylase 2 family uncharacterized protein YibQ